MEVRFNDVGRGKASWSADFRGQTDNGMPDYVWLLKQVKPHLASRDIDFTLRADGSGTVLVGGFRPAGSFQVMVPVADIEA